MLMLVAALVGPGLLSGRAQAQSYAGPDGHYYEEDAAFARDSHRTTTQFGVQLMTPLWLREPDVNPGFGVEARLGWELGNFTPEFYGGAMVNWVDVEYDHWSSPSEPLDTFWMGFGTRYSFLNPSAFVPFIGVGAQVNFWGAMLWEDAYAWDDRYRPTLGLRGSVGAAIELSAHGALELGVQGVIAHRGNVFDRHPIYVSPFVGGTFYF